MGPKAWLTGAAALCALVLASPAFSNDSSAELAQGGLVLKKHDGIAMKSEALYISPTRVQVKYEFLNTTPADQKIIVAFPMPDITTEGVDDNIAIPTEDPVNFLKFKTTVDGAPVKAEVEQRVFKNGVEHTALLKRLGVPLAPQLEATAKALDRLPPADQKKLVGLGLAVDNDYDVGHGMEHHLGAAWTLKTTYWWEQTFPAGKVLHVEHDYTPSVGGTSGTGLESDDFLKSDEFKAMKAKYCIDEAYLAAVAKRKKAAGPDHQAFFEQRIDYVLKTGANWQAPIGSFTLVLDKGDEANLLSVCETGLRKTAPTQFETHKVDFLPQQDLHILILTPAPAGF